MQYSLRVRGLLSSVLAAALVVSSTMGTVSRVAAAGPDDASAVNEANCAPLGFHIQADAGDGAAGYAATPPAPPPPLPLQPVPPPPTQAVAPPSPQVTTMENFAAPSSLGELVVTAERRRPSTQDVPIAVSAFAGHGHDTERYPRALSNPIHQTAAEPVSTFSTDVDTASYANVRRFLEDGERPPKDAVRVEELVNYFDYGYARPTSAEKPFATYVAVTPSPWSRGRQIVHIGLQGYDLPRAEAPPLNLVFLMDTSGSMEPEDRLPLAKKALNVLIDQLRPQDHVSMVAYAGSAGAVLAPTSGAEKLKMRCAVAALDSGGSTAGGEGLALAYAMAEKNFQKGAVNRVILMTDGDFNVGIDDPEKLKDFIVAKRHTGIYLSVYGYGRGNYNDIMMQGLSQNGNGTAAYVDSLDEARKLFRDDFRAQLFPIADDVKVQVEFNPSRVSEYRLIGYETRMLNREDFNNDQVDAGDVGAGASVTALYEITPVGGPLSVDSLRYGAPITKPLADRTGELAYLKIRYKLPGQHSSRLIQRPINEADLCGTVATAPEPTRWALAVAAYGQRLRGDPWLSEQFGWDQIGRLAEGARGADPYGLRSQFIDLVKDAKSAHSVNE